MRFFATIVLASVLTLVSLTAYAQQGQWYHPDADEIIAADPSDITVCQWLVTDPTETALGPDHATWGCETFWAYNARAPLMLKLDIGGPVRVWSRWAYARDVGGRLVPMQDAAY